jgi:two-component system LytT family response regulator
MGNYTIFHVVGIKDKLIVSRGLKFYEDILCDFNFVRINRKDLINLNHIKKFSRQKKSLIEMSDGILLEVVDSRRDDFLEKFEEF